MNDPAVIPLDPKAALQRCIDEFGLPQDSKAADVLQHIITVSGHTVTLLYLLQMAVMLDADVQMYITNNESVDPVQMN